MPRRRSSPCCWTLANRFDERSSTGLIPTPCRPPRARPACSWRTEERLAPEARLPLVEMAAPALCQMTPAQFHDFIRCVEALVNADQRLTLFEYALQRLLIRHVVTHFVRALAPAVKYTTIAPLAVPVATVLSALAYAGEQTPEGAARAFAAGTLALGWPEATLRLAPQGTVGIAEIDASLEVLAQAAARLKKAVLEACAACICVDGTVTIDEGELLRAVADCLGFPMPPLIASENKS